MQLPHPALAYKNNLSRTSPVDALLPAESVRFGVAATVNGQDITIADLQNQCMQTDGKKALQQLIEETLIDQAAMARHIVVTFADVSAKRNELQRDMGGTSLTDALSQQGISASMFDERIRHQLELEKLVTTPIRPALDMRHVWHTTVGLDYMDVQTGKLKRRTSSEALLILQSARRQLRAGVRFSDVARRTSDYKTTQQSGGDLGILCEGATYYSNLFPYARALKKGEYTEQSIRSYAGYELIYVSSTWEHHLPGENSAYAKAAREYRQQQLGDASTLLMESLHKRAKVTVYPLPDNQDSSSSSQLSSTQPGLTGVAAVVNGSNISIDQVGRRVLETDGPSLLSHLIESTLIDQSAKRQNIVVTEDDINIKRRELLSRLGGQSLDSAVVRHGMTMQQLESDMADQIKVEKLAHIVARHATHMRHVYHLAIAAQDAGPFAGSSVPALPGAPPLPTKAQALSKLGLIHNRLLAGEPFEDLARQFSDDIFSKKNGGDLGILHDGTNVNLDILKVALSLKKGQVSAPFKSFFGYDIVYIKSTEEDHPSDEDLLYSEADNEYRDSQTDGKIQNVLQSLEQNGKVAIYFHP